MSIKDIITSEIKLARVRLDAFAQENHKEGMAFNRGYINALATIQHDLKQIESCDI
jgi:hypothetical protein